MQNLLFEWEDHHRTGFRLQRLDVRNWGTFNRSVYTIEPRGATALLTGANGSGKSTLVDALLTLLVPNTKRNYNQAGGGERKRERDERSYVQGAYGKIKTEEAHAARTQFLRGKDEYSVLLAVFHNAAFDQHVSLAQVFWLEDDGIRKFFALATTPLEIGTHFATFSTIAELKKRLRSQNVEVFDEFARYSQRFRSLVGLRSPKALDLFNQTVSIKEIGGLNEFVRTHMLERADTQARIAELRANYNNLTRAHDAILKAQRQLDHLRPLVDEADQHAAQEQKLFDLRNTEHAAPAYFAHRKIALLDHATADATAALAQARARKQALDGQLDHLRNAHADLRAAINNDEAGQRLRDLEKDIDRIDERNQAKQKDERRYSNLARSLHLAPYSDEAAFAANAHKARDALAPLDHHIAKLTTDRDAQTIKRSHRQARKDELESELRSLRQRTSQIPTDDLRIRAGMLAALGLSETQLPFVGELLKVKTNARAWEGAIERLLRGFGRQVLVADEQYAQVNSYVNGTNLRGRLVFQRVGERRSFPVRELDRDALPHKVDMKPDTPFHAWLKAELHEAYNHICCDDEERFRHEHRALTRSGLIKSGGARHEKDDRRPLNDRTLYVLGWDNRDKIKAFEAELHGIERELQAIDTTIRTIEKEQRQREEQRRGLQELLTFASFQSIDWQRDAAQIRQMRDRQRQLEQSSDRLTQLQQDLAALQKQITQAQTERDDAAKREALCERDLQDYAEQHRECQTQLGVIPAAEAARYAPLVEAQLKGDVLHLANIRDRETKLIGSIHRALRDEQGRLNKLAQSLVVRMTDYKHAYPQDTTDVDATIEALDDYRRMLDTIERDDLPRHAARFKDLLNEKVVNDIVHFKSALETHEQDIRDSIGSLNQSLRMIDYTPSTYIELRCEASRDQEVREFKHLLRDCLPDVGQASTPENNEASFQKIKSLILRFEDDDRWAGKVTDVRQWLDFSASERYKDDTTEKSYYSDSSGKSGGQKAKLAYTILASAIAYQFGLDADAARAHSFRFVVVDEAFSKSDETNARYAMELFKRLNLQLLVVTPLDKTHVVEPYIAACHFVWNNAEENDSRVVNLGIAEYHARKAVLHASATP